MLTVLYDNYGVDPSLRHDWGFSCLVEGYSQCVLFDTGGDGQTLLHNMVQTGIEPARIGAVVLSHDHADHTGGLAALLRVNPHVTVYMHEAFSEAFKTAVRELGAAVVVTGEPTQVCPGISTTPVFAKDMDEQGLCVKTEQGLTLITGCAHPGIARMVHVVRQTFGRRVDTVLGGFHMEGAWSTSVNLVIAQFREAGVLRVGPCHCSGENTRSMMSRAFRNGYLDVGVGRKIPLAHSLQSA